MGGKTTRRQAVAYVMPDVRRRLDRIVVTVKRTDSRFSMSILVENMILKCLPEEEARLNISGQKTMDRSQD